MKSRRPVSPRSQIVAERPFHSGRRGLIRANGSGPLWFLRAGKIPLNLLTDPKMNAFMSDHELMERATERFGMDAEMLMQRYYGSILDARLEMEEFLRSGRLQTSFATMLRARLGLRSVAFGDAG
jgi:hypothetical protein